MHSERWSSGEKKQPNLMFAGPVRVSLEGMVLNMEALVVMRSDLVGTFFLFEQRTKNNYVAGVSIRFHTARKGRHKSKTYTCSGLHQTSKRCL